MKNWGWKFNSKTLVCKGKGRKGSRSERKREELQRGEEGEWCGGKSKLEQ